MASGGRDNEAKSVERTLHQDKESSLGHSFSVVCY